MNVLIREKRELRHREEGHVKMKAEMRVTYLQIPQIADSHQELKGVGSFLGCEGDSIHPNPGFWHTQVFLGL